MRPGTDLEKRYKHRSRAAKEGVPGSNGSTCSRQSAGIGQIRQGLLCQVASKRTASFG